MGMTIGRSRAVLDRLGREVDDATVARRHALARLAAPRLTSNETTEAARQLNRAAGLLAASVLFDSAVEHYRGGFYNRAMWTPLAVSSLSLAASAHGVADDRPGAHRARDAVYALSALTGLAGTGFHIANIRKRVGGFSWNNLFYAAPIGAPMAIFLSGMLGATAERVRHNLPGTTPAVFGWPAGRVVAGVTSLGLLGTVGEAGLLHFRGSFQNPAMYIPVTLPPLAAALIARAAIDPPGRRKPWTALLLRLVAVAGVAGVGFHAWGVQRMMGGWRNWDAERDRRAAAARAAVLRGPGAGGSRGARVAAGTVPPIEEGQGSALDPPRGLPLGSLWISRR